MSPPPASAADDLVSLLDLTPVDQDKYRGHSPPYRWGRVFGGQVVAQAMVAALRTVEDRTAHSLHAYFLRPGDPKVPIDYEVDRIRDGKSFTTRRVVARQGSEAIYMMGISLQRPEVGLEHQSEMPPAPPPESLPDEATLAKTLPKALKGYIDTTWPIEMRPVDIDRFIEPAKHKPSQRIWMRTRGRLDPGLPFALHQCILAYASDYSLVDTGLIGHDYFLNDPRLQIASLDHVVWFHRPFRADEWLLYVQDSPSAQASRAFCRGSIYSRDGALVASVAQEALVRLHLEG